ncbi:TPA: undecaprenyl-diphosphate phosphatase [Candidatus Woesearchaeota archaeon]|nr:undecaprenyl-diphosphate phosphatase [Candidatus Woesearchaeota archaeon]HIH32093.1 undecaprenyl-diphosphate phosphatase [Candidatus Woesearchaeota archaeon]HIH54917.1 undecaprenyl-diphosphate phosphatase [Candidatus Woesearchaeota archaeon]HIJ01792.1 undecaprenyl-diphosphate phosphatase [Candidatus Woesearchaeota archaeon]HIJ14035.1 undecaprenyl-diphosphate phosphatase [Candidatus Woesearchaeota archaeon]
MDIFQAIILGIVQGITEWLPVSSSGHLVIMKNIFNLDQPLIFDIMLHIGSLIVVLSFFRKEILELMTGLINWEKEKLKIILMIIIATIPIAIAGYFFQSWIESVFNDLRTVGFSLLFTALILFLSKYPSKKNKELSIGKAFVIGLFQAIAILPGVSRSGSTISFGMMLGIKKEDAARFSFLIFIPAILGALILHINDINYDANITPMIIGTLFSAVIGYFSLKLLMNLIKKNKFSWFSAYCLVLGLIVLAITYS